MPQPVDKQPSSFPSQPASNQYRAGPPGGKFQGLAPF